MLKQYETITAQKLEERRESKDRRPSLRTSTLLKESFEALSKPLVFSLGASCKENNSQFSFSDKELDKNITGPILKMISSKK
jgi:hypothetical protein